MKKRIISLILSLALMTPNIVHAADDAVTYEMESYIRDFGTYEIAIDEATWTYDPNWLGIFTPEGEEPITVNGTKLDEKSCSIIYAFSRFIVGSGLSKPFSEDSENGFVPAMILDSLTPGGFADDKSWGETPNDLKINGSLATTKNWDISRLDKIFDTSLITFKENLDPADKEFSKKIYESMKAGNYILIKVDGFWYFVEGLILNEGNPTFQVFDTLKGIIEMDIKEPEAIEVWNADVSLEPTIAWYKEKNKDTNEEGIPVYLMLFNEQNKTNQETINTCEFVKSDDIDLNVNKCLVEDLEALYTDSLEETGIGLKVLKAHETPEETEKFYNKSSQKFNDKWGMKPYASEHNLGIAIDIDNNAVVKEVKEKYYSKEKDDVKAYEGFSKVFKGKVDATTKKYYTWLLDNSYKYGFILRYPANVSDRTGLEEIPNHFRYIGKDYAKRFYEYTNKYTNDKVYEDFYEEVVQPDFATERLKENQVDYLVNKNYYSNNLVRLYSDVFKHPIKYLLRVVSSGMQIIHNTTADGGIANILNCDFVFNFLIDKGVFSFIGFSCTAMVGLSIFYYGFLMLRKIVNWNFIIKRTIFAILISAIPLIFFPVVSKFMKQLSYVGMKDITYQSLLENMQYYRSKEDEEEELVIDTYERYVVYSDSELDEIAFTEKMEKEEVILIDFSTSSLENKYTNTQLTIPELSDTLYGDTFWDATEYSELDIQEKWLPVCGKFIPTHFNQYDESVFYYFYDWLTYQYISYYGRERAKDPGRKSIAQNFILPDGTGTTEEYRESFEKAFEGMFKRSKNGFIEMYSNDRYVYTEDYINDLFGLSNLFDTSFSFNFSESSLSKWAHNELRFYNESAPTFASISEKLPAIENLAEFDKESYLEYLILCKTRNESPKELAYISLEDISHLSPLAKIVSGYPWNLYSMSTRSGKQDFVVSSERSLQHLSGTFAGLYKEMGTTEEATSFEKKLNKVTEKAYARISKAMKQASNNVSDDVMMMYIALVVTSEFNAEFSGLSHEVQPQGIDVNSFTIDSLYRSVFGLNNSLYRNKFFMYAVTDKYNIIVSFLIMISDLLLWITGAIRVFLIGVLSVSLLVAVFNILFSIKGRPGIAFAGAIIQAFTLVFIQLGYIGLLKLITYLTRDSLTAVLSSLILLVGISIILSLTIASSFAIVQSMTTVGGLNIAELLFELSNRIKSPIKSENKDTELNSDSYELDEKLKEETKSVLNSKRVRDNLTEDEDS